MRKGIPNSPAELYARYDEMHKERMYRKTQVMEKGATRSKLTGKQREKILEKTDSRCHLCGGQIDGEWQADHVLAHSGGGLHAEENYLPAHRICNNYR